MTRTAGSARPPPDTASSRRPTPTRGTCSPGAGSARSCPRARAGRGRSGVRAWSRSPLLRRRRRGGGLAALDLAADDRRDLGAVELDRAHDARVRHRAHAELHEEAVVPEGLVLEENLLDHLLRAADEVRAVEAGAGVEL